MKKNQRKILIVVGLIVLVILLLILMFFLYKRKMNNINNQNQVVSIELDDKSYKKMKSAENEEILKNISEMTEQKRIHYYASEFIKAVEARNYKKAYSFLNSDFKDNYFKTYEAFEDYAKKYFPKEMSVNYDNMERLGNIYVLVAVVKDILSKDPNDFEFYIVIKENAYNNFELSFSVDKPMAKYENTENNN